MKTNLKQGDPVLYRGRPMRVSMVHLDQHSVALYDEMDLADYEKVRASEVIPIAGMKASEVRDETIRQMAARVNLMAQELYRLMSHDG